MKLTDQVAVVTGASSGIGRAIALALAAAGALVWAVGRSREALEETVAAAQAGARMRGVSMDLTDDDAIERLRGALADEHGAVDLLVHCAGAIEPGRFDEAPVSALDRQFLINVRAPYLLTQALLPGIRARRGQIVFINSSAGLQARAGVGQYAATKHALRALADSLREELNPEGVRVLSIYPGRTASPMQAVLFAREGRPYRPELLLQPEDVAAAALSALTMPRTAEVTDITVRPLTKAS